MDFFTADWHLNGELIRNVCNRHFKSAKRMTEVYIKQANQRAKNKSDNIIHVGDFIQHGLDRGTGIKEDQLSTQDVLKQLNANVILLEGNHDSNNKCNTVGKVLIRKVGKFDCIIQHYPSSCPKFIDLCENKYKKYITINICGHVHDNWAFWYDDKRSILNCNVGIDIYPFMIKEYELAKKIDDMTKKLCYIFKLPVATLI